LRAEVEGRIRANYLEPLFAGLKPSESLSSIQKAYRRRGVDVYSIRIRLKALMAAERGIDPESIREWRISQAEKEAIRKLLVSDRNPKKPSWHTIRHIADKVGVDGKSVEIVERGLIAEMRKIGVKFPSRAGRENRRQFSAMRNEAIVEYARHHPEATYPEIGKIFGDRSTSLVSHLMGGSVRRKVPLPPSKKSKALRMLSSGKPRREIVAKTGLRPKQVTDLLKGLPKEARKKRKERREEAEARRVKGQTANVNRMYGRIPNLQIADKLGVSSRTLYNSVARIKEGILKRKGLDPTDPRLKGLMRLPIAELKTLKPGDVKNLEFTYPRLFTFRNGGIRRWNLHADNPFKKEVPRVSRENPGVMRSVLKSTDGLGKRLKHPFLYHQALPELAETLGKRAFEERKMDNDREAGTFQAFANAIFFEIQRARTKAARK
jgi:DNA-binding Lrp family transcriptional regulator